MLALPGIFTLIRKMPKFFMLILLTITIVLLAFLLLGCTKLDSTYSNIYLVKYQFNHSSALYDKISSAYTNEDMEQLSSMEIKVNYLGICVDIGSNVTCSTVHNMESFENISSISLISDSTNSSNSTSTDLNLAQLSVIFADKICHTSVLIATEIITIILFFIVLWSSIPFLPGSNTIGLKASVIFSFIDVILWGLGSMLAHEASKAGVDFVEPASFHIIQGTIGARAQSMIWTSFSFILIVAIGCAILYIGDLKSKAEEIEIKV